MKDPAQGDELWQAAMAWVMREHESPLDDAARMQLAAWLQDPRHRAALDEARRVWLITGLVPPSTTEG